MDFQKTVLKQFEFMNKQFGKMDQRFGSLEGKVEKVDESQDLMAMKMSELCEKVDRIDGTQKDMQKDLTFIKGAVEEDATRQKGIALEVAALHSRVTRCEMKVGII